jgi:hypothetical protein
VSGNEVFDFLPQFGIAPANLSQIRFALLSVDGQRCVKHLFYLAPAI